MKRTTTGSRLRLRYEIWKACEIRFASRATYSANHNRCGTKGLTERTFEPEFFFGESHVKAALGAVLVALAAAVAV